MVTVATVRLGSTVAVGFVVVMAIAVTVALIVGVLVAITVSGSKDSEERSNCEFHCFEGIGIRFIYNEDFSIF